MHGDGVSEQNRTVAKDMVIHHLFIPVRIKVGGEHARDNAQNEKYRELLQEADQVPGLVQIISSC